MILSKNGLALVCATSLLLTFPDTLPRLIFMFPYDQLEKNVLLLYSNLNIPEAELKAV